MSSKRKKLGGFADIYQAESLDGAISRIRLERIVPSSDQPRQNRKHNIEELAQSIATDGLLSPLVVTKEDDNYRIIAGERRFHAISSLGWKDVECRVISREQRDYYRIAIIENLQRENLSAHEEAAALYRLKNQENYSDAELARIVGKSRNYITEILGVAQLPENIKGLCQAAGLEHRNIMIQFVQSYKKGFWQEFLEAWNGGAIRTIRDARNFNQRQSKPSQTEPENPELQPTSKDDPSIANTTTEEGDKRGDLSTAALTLRIRGSRITIDCPSAEAAKDLAKEIAKLKP